MWRPGSPSAAIRWNARWRRSRPSGNIRIRRKKPFMFERVSCSLLSVALVAGMAQGQERKTRIDVDKYTIDVDINQRTQSLSAKTAVRFTPLDDNTTSVPFELNNALNVSKVVDEQGRQLQASRS